MSSRESAGANTGASGPRAAYDERLARRKESAAALERRMVQISRGRVACFFALVAVLVCAGMEVLHVSWAAVPALGFFALVVRHESVARARARVDGAVAYYEDGLRRLDGAWAGHGVDRDLADADHLYAADLDLFGAGSVFELLCTARTRAGEGTLARWLLQAGGGGIEIEELQARHRAIDCLRERVDLREDLFQLGHALRVSVDAERLATWAQQPEVFPAKTRGWMRVVAWALGLAAVLGLALWIAGYGPYPLLGVLTVEALVLRTTQARFEAITHPLDGLTKHLRVLTAVLERLEREPAPDGGRLVELRALLIEGGTSASRQIDGLARLVDWLDARRSALFFPIAFALMWTWHFGLALEGWRARASGSVARWFEGLGEYEALIAMSGYAYENPEDPFPELTTGGPRLELEDAGHPLIPRDACVRNSVRLGDPLRVLVVSGSNMSGKSTLLRTIGCNVVLALTGAPVRAARLRLSPLRLGASLRVEDSLMAGRSRFYSGLLRLRAVVGMAQRGEPALFLLDEILHGTNSHDRRIGAEAVVRTLVGAGAVGLVTTHDLALARVADSLGEQAANVHFADELEGDKLVFDYRMRDGVVDRSNALDLMRAVGLDV